MELQPYSGRRQRPFQAWQTSTQTFDVDSYFVLFGFST